MEYQKNGNEQIKNKPLHLIRCLGDFAALKLISIKMDIVRAIDDAEDVWGNDE